MNKKLNYVLFILAATVVNIIIMILLFLIPFILLIIIFDEGVNSMLSFLYVILPIFSIAGGYIIYSKIYKFFRKKVDMDKYFEPIFKRRS